MFTYFTLFSSCENILFLKIYDIDFSSFSLNDRHPSLLLVQLLIKSGFNVFSDFDCDNSFSLCCFLFQRYGSFHIHVNAPKKSPLCNQINESLHLLMFLIQAVFPEIYYFVTKYSFPLYFKFRLLFMVIPRLV